MTTIAARDVHPGDAVRVNDWDLHVAALAVSDGRVDVVTVEFGAGIPLHWAATELVDVTRYEVTL